MNNKWLSFKPFFSLLIDNIDLIEEMHLLNASEDLTQEIKKSKIRQIIDDAFSIIFMTEKNINFLILILVFQEFFNENKSL